MKIIDFRVRPPLKGFLKMVMYTNPDRRDPSVFGDERLDYNEALQAHYANGATLVEGGQLMLMTYDLNVVPEPGTAVLMMLGLAGLASSRANRGKR